jgi:hypothetical protein
MANPEKDKTPTRATRTPARATATRAEKPAREKPPAEAVDETPSGKALAAVGNLDGETVDPADVEKALEHGEKYQAEKKKHRWG